jgi:hypothetical protein
MLIKNLFERDIFRAISGVVKADQLDDSQELDEFLVTKELDLHIRKLFASFLDAIDHKNDTDIAGKIGIWVSGFFGSGKSHFIKVLSYLLRNQQVSVNRQSKRAVDFFESKIKDAMLMGDIKRAVSSNTDVILFNIDSKASHKGGRDAILQVFLKVLNDMQGYSPDHAHIAHMKRHLEEKGKFNKFKEAFRAVNIATASAGVGVLDVDTSTFTASGSTLMGESGGEATIGFENYAVGSFADITMANSSFTGSGAQLIVQAASTVGASGNLLMGPGVQSGQYAFFEVDGTGSTFTQTGATSITLGSSANSDAVIAVADSGSFYSGTGTITVNKTGEIETLAGGTFNANGNVILNGGSLLAVFAGVSDGIFNLAPGKNLTAQNGCLVLGPPDCSSGVETTSATEKSSSVQ